MKDMGFVRAEGKVSSKREKEDTKSGTLGALWCLGIGRGGKARKGTEEAWLVSRRALLRTKDCHLSRGRFPESGLHVGETTFGSGTSQPL